MGDQIWTRKMYITDYTIVGANKVTLNIWNMMKLIEFIQIWVTGG